MDQETWTGWWGATCTWRFWCRRTQVRSQCTTFRPSPIADNVLILYNRLWSQVESLRGQSSRSWSLSNHRSIWVWCPLLPSSSLDFHTTSRCVSGRWNVVCGLRYVEGTVSTRSMKVNHRSVDTQHHHDHHGNQTQPLTPWQHPGTTPTNVLFGRCSSLQTRWSPEGCAALSPQMLVRDHLDKPASRVPVRLTDKQLIMEGGNSVDMSCQDSGTSGPDGLVYFICNPLKNSVRAVLKVRKRSLLQLLHVMVSFFFCFYIHLLCISSLAEIVNKIFCVCFYWAFSLWNLFLPCGLI